MDNITPHRARKRFGQNFLIDENIIQRLLWSIRPRTGQTLVEIGPGQGALTEGLLQHCPDLHVIELDRDLIPLLQARFSKEFPRLSIHQGDALQFDFSTLVQDQQPLRIVGNLPYNISTPLIFHLLEFRNIIGDMHFMLQKEVVARMASAPGEKAWGRLGIMTQYFCDVEMLFEVPPASFSPAPKVDSAIVRLTPLAQPANPVDDHAMLDLLVKTAFQQRRKTLRNTLRTLLDERQLHSLQIDPNLRPENLSLSDYVMIANFLSSLKEPDHADGHQHPE